MNNFYKILRELRQEKGILQNELAQKIGYSQASVSDWENEVKQPTADTLIAVARFFDVSTDYLLGLEDENGYKIP